VLLKHGTEASTVSWRLLPLLLFFALAGHGQAVLIGTVVDEAGRPVEGASLVVRPHPEGTILGFSLSSSTGAYSIRLAEDLDSLWLTVSHLSYTPQEILLHELSEPLGLILSAHAYELPELALSEPAVVRKGDTLAFDVNRLKELEDDNIEQVLARIPGITIESSGRIFYEDLPISKFYIEGLDLLEGRYALATRNLSVEAVRDIEILERHQPILALDSLITPPNAAINLRLKSKVALVGEVEAAGGVSPALYAASGHLFSFQKQQQVNLLSAGNNIGDQQRSNFKGLYESPSAERMLVRPTVIYPPIGVGMANALDNQELTGGFNFLRRISAHGQLKLQAFGSSDLLMYRGRKERALRDAEQEVRFDERLKAEETLRLLNGRLIYELNKPSFYAKASIESERGSTATAANNQVNGQASLEDLMRSKWLARGRGEAILRRGDKAYRLWAKMDYQDADMGLELRPLDLLVGTSPIGQLERAIQDVRKRDMTTEVYTSFVLRRGRIIGDFKSGIRTYWHRIGSDLSELAVDGSQESLGPLFRNDTEQRLWVSYFEQDYTWRREKGEWRLFLPVAFHRLALEDGLGADMLQRGLIVFQPRLSYLPRRGGFSANFAYRRDYNEDQLFYNNFILLANRQFDRQAFAINQRNTYELNLRHERRHISTGLYHNSQLSLSATRADLITTTVFDSLGQVSRPTVASNVQRRANWESRLELDLMPALRAKLEGRYIVLSRPSDLNGARINVLIHQASATPYLVYTFKSSVLSCRPQAAFFASNISESPVWRTQLSWVFFQQLPKQWGNIKLSFNQYHTMIGQQAVSNQLLNFQYEYSLPIRKLRASLQLNNLTNERNFITFNQESFYEELGFFRLRPLQIILRVAKKL
jgi:hypothetical protein